MAGLPLREIVAVPGYSDRVDAAVEALASASDHPEVLRLLKAAIAALGVEAGFFVSFVRDDTDIAACRFLLACDPDWCQRYLQAACIVTDPWLGYASRHIEPTVASRLDIAPPGHGDASCIATHCGFASAALFPAHSGAGHSRISLLCLGSPVPGFFESPGFERLRLGARTLAAELHDWWMARNRRELTQRHHLAPADFELLGFELKGYTSKRIGAELGVSPSAVNSRFQRINAKLGVPNRRAAMRLVLELGLLPP